MGPLEPRPCRRHVAALHRRGERRAGAGAQVTEVKLLTRREDTVAPQRSRVRLSLVGKEGSAVDTRASYSHHAHRGPQREVAPGRLTSEHRAFPGFDSRRPPTGRAQGRAVRAAELPHEALAVAQRRAMVGNVRHPPRSRSRLPPGTPVAIRITRASYPFRESRIRKSTTRPATRALTFFAILPPSNLPHH